MPLLIMQKDSSQLQLRTNYEVNHSRVLVRSRWGTWPPKVPQNVFVTMCCFLLVIIYQLNREGLEITLVTDLLLVSPQPKDLP